MGVLANLIADSQPAYYGGGMSGGGTEGATWRSKFGVTLNGSAVDLSGVTITCHIIDKVGGSVVVAPTCAGAADGTLTIEVDEAATVGLAGSTTARACKWWVTLNDGTDTWQLWGAANSTFRIYPKGA